MKTISPISLRVLFWKTYFEKSFFIEKIVIAILKYIVLVVYYCVTGYAKI